MATTLCAQAVLAVEDRPRKPYFLFTVLLLYDYIENCTQEGNVLSATKNVAI